ncbi:MAG: GntR family transcriptional regulator [Desulfotignum sp.]|nr:GntR family transcriptional regulator [Desulfotignum sp.]
MNTELIVPDLGASNIPDKVRDILKTAIYDRRLKPGDKLPSEEELRKQFKVSKTVMREALGQLVAEGLIEKRRGALGGSFVAEGNSERILHVVLDCYHLGGLTIEEVIDFRRNIEPIVLEMACARREDSDLDMLKTNLDTCRQALEKGTIDRHNQVDFHRLIAVACHNGLLASSMGAAIKISREFTSKLPFSLPEAKEDFEYNEKFFECIKNNRFTQARELMAAHFERSKMLVKRYRSLDPKK